MEKYWYIGGKHRYFDIVDHRSPSLEPTIFLPYQFHRTYLFPFPIDIIFEKSFQNWKTQVFWYQTVPTVFPAALVGFRYHKIVRKFDLKFRGLKLFGTFFLSKADIIIHAVLSSTTFLTSAAFEKPSSFHLHYRGGGKPGVEGIRRLFQGHYGIKRHPEGWFSCKGVSYLEIFDRGCQPLLVGRVSKKRKLSLDQRKVATTRIFSVFSKKLINKSGGKNAWGAKKLTYNKVLFEVECILCFCKIV